MNRGNHFMVRHILTIFVFLSNLQGSQSNEAKLLCPTQCTCKDKTWQDVLGKYNQKHAGLRGEDYRSKSRKNAPQNYSDSFGIFSHAFINDMVEVNCLVKDKKKHFMSEFLNTIHQTRYTAIELRCEHNEEILWDIHSWESTINVFVNEHCRISSPNENNTIVMPQNVWVIENYGFKDFLTNMRLDHAMNLLALITAESPSKDYPRLRLHLPYIQAISYHSNNLKEFDCDNLSIGVHLDTLNLGGNELSYFPHCLANPDELTITYISLSHNLISNLTILVEDIPEENEILSEKKSQLDSSGQTEIPILQKEPNIKILDLSHNKISSLGIFIEISSLTTLDLSHNMINKINYRSFKNLPNLSWLSLSHNHIHLIHNQLFSSSLNLRQLDLSSNELDNVESSMLPQAIKSFDFDISLNRLRYPLLFNCMDESREKHKGLNSIRIRGSGNPYLCDCKAIEVEKCINKLKKSGKIESLPDLNKFTCQAPRDTRGMTYMQLSLQNKCTVEDDCPLGCNCYLLTEQTLVVNCSSRHLLELPDNLPDVGNDKYYVLLLNHNPIQLLGYRPYLHKLSELYIHNCLLSAVTTDAMNALKDVQVLALHKNLLKRLPTNTQNMSMEGLKNLTLHGNRWVCDCEHIWLTKWLKTRSEALWAPSKVQCAYSRRPLTELSESEVTCDTDYVDVALVACMVASTFISTLYVFYYYRHEIHQLLYIKLGIRLWDTFKYNSDSYSVYDAFVFYSQNNYKWVVDTLLERLEKGPIRYKLCLHFRDFPKDEIAVENIPLAISLSRCSLLLLSKDFLENEWRIPNLRTAFQRYLFGADSLIIIVTDDVHPDDLTPDLKAYMASHEVLHINDENFWQKLEYFLPPPRFQNDETSQDVTSKEIGDDKQNNKVSNNETSCLSELLDGTIEKEESPVPDGEPLEEMRLNVADVRCQGDFS